MPKKFNQILLTGAAGIVGRAIRPLLAARCEELLLTDIKQVDDTGPGERFEAGDITDLAFLSELASGADAIVHLAGHVGPDFTFEEVMGANMIGTRNAFEAARRNGVERVVYASSHHAIGFMSRGDRIDHSTAPRPDSYYGLSKAFGEEVGAYYADRFGLRVLAIRIGYVGGPVIDERRLHTWCSPRDLDQLVGIGLEHSEIRFEKVYGVSDNPGPFFDNSNAVRLGYTPQDRSVDHLADENLRTAQPDPETDEGRYIGGHFTSA